jgi:hypothetical protein
MNEQSRMRSTRARDPNKTIMKQAATGHEPRKLKLSGIWLKTAQLNNNPFHRRSGSGSPDTAFS